MSNLKPMRKGPKWRRLTRALLRSRDGCFCYWCKKPMVFPDGKPAMNSSVLLATIEHLVERRNGGTDDLSNLVLAHHSCNRKRDHLTSALERLAA